MATLTEYLKHLQGEYKPQPSPIDEDIVQKAEAYDHLTGRTESEVESNE